MPTVAMGTTIKKSAGSAIASLTSIAGLELSADTIETTALDSVGGYRTFVQGLKDAGEVSISGFFDFAAHNAILTDFNAGTSASYIITFPGGKTWTFDGIVTGFSTGAELEDLVSFESTFKVSGKPVLA
jgi:predicted secreted protein